MRFLAITIAALLLPAAALAQEPTFADAGPLFATRCVMCHGGAAPPEGLRLDTLENILAGGDRIVVIPGRAEASEVFRRLAAIGGGPPMPFGGPPLGDAEIDLIRRWIDGGARDLNGIAAPIPAGGEVRYQGVMTGPQEIDGVLFAIDAETRMEDRPALGEEAELRGVVEADGTIRATRLEAE